jgi:hypothetical protein
MTSKAYIAGFLDGEGTVGISVSRSTAGYPIPTLRVAFANFHEGIIDDIQKVYGGSKSTNKNEVHSLHINGQAAYELLVDIQRWVLIKRKAVRAAIRFHEIDFVSPDDNPHEYVRKLEAALRVMEATREGYKAQRGTKMMDKLKEAIKHVRTTVRDTHLGRQDVPTV